MDDKNNILLSIIIPVYNTEKYLRTLMWSLKNQITDEIEIIIVDGSDKNYEKQYSNYKNTKYYHIKNRTAGCSRNYGIDHSIGQYIAFIDSDDIVSNNYVKNILNKIRKNNFDYCFFHWSTIGKERNTCYINKNNIPTLWAVWTRVWNRDFIGDIRFQDDLIVAEDKKFIEDLCNGKSYDTSNKIELINDIMYYYFIGRDDNLCTLFNSGKIDYKINNE